MTYTRSRSFLFSLCVPALALLTLAGCGGTNASSTGGSTPSPTPAPDQQQTPTVASFGASSASVQAGGSVTLAWSVQNASSVAISPGGFTSTQLSGTYQVAPTATTQYTITASNVNGKTATATVTVTVTPAAPPSAQGPAVSAVACLASGSATTCPSTATNTVTVLAGQSALIAWTSTDATQTTDPTGNTQGASGYYVTPQFGPGDVGTPKLFTVSATNGAQTATGTVTVNVQSLPNAGSITAVNHVIFLLQENRTFDEYFGRMNEYRASLGLPTTGAAHVDGLPMDKNGNIIACNPDTKHAAPKLLRNNPAWSGLQPNDPYYYLSDPSDPNCNVVAFHSPSTCMDDMTSAWQESHREVAITTDSTWTESDYSVLGMNGFSNVAGNFANYLYTSNGSLPGPGGTNPNPDLAGWRAMGVYDWTDLPWYYWMGAQFAISDRWFSPIASKSIPNRIATITGGTTFGYVWDPGRDDTYPDPNNPTGPALHPNLPGPTIFDRLDAAGVSWKIYISDVMEGSPDTTILNLPIGSKYICMTPRGSCNVQFPDDPSNPSAGTTSTNWYYDPSRIGLISGFVSDMQAGALPAFSYIEAEYGDSDEHPGGAQSIQNGQRDVANLVNVLMNSPSWKDSVFFVSYDEGGGPYDHVAPIPAVIGANATVAPDQHEPCPYAAGTYPGNGCDLKTGHDPQIKLEAQIGFRLPNLIISPFTVPHAVIHTPMDHTAVLKFVETRWNLQPLTARDAAQPDLSDPALGLFDFANAPSLSVQVPSSIQNPAVNPNLCRPGAFATQPLTDLNGRSLGVYPQ